MHVTSSLKNTFIASSFEIKGILGPRFTTLRTSLSLQKYFVVTPRPLNLVQQTPTRETTITLIFEPRFFLYLDADSLAYAKSVKSDSRSLSACWQSLKRCSLNGSNAATYRPGPLGCVGWRLQANSISRLNDFQRQGTNSWSGAVKISRMSRVGGIVESGITRH